MVRVRVFRLKLAKKFACLQFKFIKDILGWGEPKFTKFHKPFLVKKVLCYLLEKFQVLLVFWQDFVIQPYCVEVASAIKISRLRHTCYKASSSSNKPCIDCTTRAIEQNIRRMLHSKNFQFYCTNIAAPPFATMSAFLAKFYTKSSKKCGLLATLVKFNQASNPHPLCQQKFVKKTLYTHRIKYFKLA